MRGTSWVILLLGAWLAISPMVLHVAGLLSINNLACGLLALLVGVWGVMSMARMHVPGWLGIVIGLWVLFAPWALGADAAGAPILANNALCGSVMAIFGVARSTSGPVRTVA